jgi:hypothetical protein
MQNEHVISVLHRPHSWDRSATDVCYACARRLLPFTFPLLAPWWPPLLPYQTFPFRTGLLPFPSWSIPNLSPLSIRWATATSRWVSAPQASGPLIKWWCFTPTCLLSPSGGRPLQVSESVLLRPAVPWLNGGASSRCRSGDCPPEISAAAPTSSTTSSACSTNDTSWVLLTTKPPSRPPQKLVTFHLALLMYLDSSA